VRQDYVLSISIIVVKSELSFFSTGDTNKMSTNNPKEDVIELDDDTSDDEILECWTGKSDGQTRNTQQNVASRKPLVDMRSYGKDAPKRLSASTSTSQVTAAAGRSDVSTTNQPSTFHSAKCPAPSKNQLSWQLTKHRSPNSFGPEVASWYATQRTSAGTSTARPATDKNEPESAASDDAELDGKPKAKQLASGTKRIFVLPASDDVLDDSDSDSSYCVIDDQQAAPAFGEQRCTVGSTVHDAIFVNSSSDSDGAEKSDGADSSNLAILLPEVKHVVLPYRPSYLAEAAIRRKERQQRKAIRQAQELRVKSGINKLVNINVEREGTALESRKRSCLDQSDAMQNTADGQYNANLPPVQCLRTMPAVGRRNRAFGLASSTVQSSTKPPSILCKASPCRKINQAPTETFSVARTTHEDEASSSKTCNERLGDVAQVEDMILQPPSGSASAATFNATHRDIATDSKMPALEPEIGRAKLSDDDTTFEIGPAKLSNDDTLEIGRAKLSDDDTMRSVAVEAVERGANESSLLMVECNSHSHLFEDDMPADDEGVPDIETGPVDPPQPALGCWVVSVDHLSRNVLDPRTNLPTWEFTVHGGDDCKCWKGWHYIVVEAI
jgi:hypothetical protein